MGLGTVNVPGLMGMEALAAKKKAQEALDAAQEAAKAAQTAQKTADDAGDAVAEFVKTIYIVPTQNGNLTYTGSAQSPTWNSYDSDKLTLGGKTSGTDAGTYSATFTPKEDYRWEDGTKTAKTVTWTIGRAAISDAPTQKGSLIYTGSVQTPSWNNYDSGKMTLGGTTSATDAGSYSATVTPKANYRWSDGSTEAKSVTWAINKASLTVPSQSESLTYTGSAQSPAWSNYDSGKMTIGGTTSGTNAGSYTATFTPKANYQWSDGSTSAKSVTWSIGKAAGSLSLNKTSMSLDVSALTGTISVTRSGDGAITASSSNTSVATVSVSGTAVTVTAKGSGSATITINVGAGTNHTAPSSKTCSITVTMPSSTLANNTPATIQAAAKAGTASNYWSVGDKIGIAINGSFGDLSYNGTVYAFILGFNHNSSVEGNNSIHFQFGKTSAGVDIAFVKDYAFASSGFCMNTNYTNNGGWASSRMRTIVCPAFLAALPTAWQNVIVACAKYSDNTGGGSDTASYVTKTLDKIWLPSEFEVYGTRTYANSAEKNYQKQYDYYKNGNSKIKYKHDETTKICKVALRSVKCDDTEKFLLAAHVTGGVAARVGYDYAAGSYGFAPGFMVA